MSYQLLIVKFPPENWRTLAQGLSVASAISKIEDDHKSVAGKLLASSDQSLGEEHYPTQPVDHIG